MIENRALIYQVTAQIPPELGDFSLQLSLSENLSEALNSRAGAAILRLTAAGSSRTGTHTDLLKINSEYSASLILARCRETSAGNHRGHLRFDESLNPDIIIAARLQPGNEDILDYYLMPRTDILRERLNLKPHNGLICDVYRFQNLKFFVELARREPIEEAA